jgi:hypothetical protein
MHANCFVGQAREKGNAAVRRTDAAVARASARTFADSDVRRARAETPRHFASGDFQKIKRQPVKAAVKIVRRN